MFILDTNVVSELRKAKAGKADANVVAWAEDQNPSALFLSRHAQPVAGTCVLVTQEGVSLCRDPLHPAAGDVFVTLQLLDEFVDARLRRP